MAGLDNSSNNDPPASPLQKNSTDDKDALEKEVRMHCNDYWLKTIF